MDDTTDPTAAPLPAPLTGDAFDVLALRFVAAMRAPDGSDQEAQEARGFLEAWVAQVDAGAEENNLYQELAARVGLDNATDEPTDTEADAPLDGLREDVGYLLSRVSDLEDNE